MFNINIFKGIAGVPKHLVNDIVGGTDSFPNQSNSSLQKVDSCPQTNEDNGQQISKKIKVEVKEEPTEEPDSTTS